jgi:hypothetical protein
LADSIEQELSTEDPDSESGPYDEGRLAKRASSSESSQESPALDDPSDPPQLSD